MAEKFEWRKIKKPIFVLAPMAGLTTFPFRSICKEKGADVTYTPMISALAVIHNPKDTLKIADFKDWERPVIVQIFGSDGETILKAAKIVDEAINPAGIDINMGCPAPEITGNECGSALLKDLDKALETAKVVRDGFAGQLSVKLRLGWQDFSILEFAKNLEKAGVDGLAIHGRTTKQRYTGEADWEMIYRAAAELCIPVIGNGDIKSWQTAYDRLSGGKISGVMIGRGSLGNPWIFEAIKKKKTLEISREEFIGVIKTHLTRQIEFMGDEKRAVLEMRKFLGWYLKGSEGLKTIRKEAVLANSPKDVLNILQEVQSLENFQKIV